MNVLEKANAIKNGELKALDNVNNYIKVIDDKNPEINAFIELNKEESIKKAKEIDEKI